MNRSNILAHNHLFGNLSPSQAYLDPTKKLVKGLRFMDLEILDHLILTKEGYLSFADEGMM